MQNIRLGNIEESDSASGEEPELELELDEEENNDDSDEEREESGLADSREQTLQRLNNRNFNAHRDAKPREERKKKDGLDSEDIKNRVSRTLRSQDNQQNYKQHSKRNLVKGKEKRRNRDVVKSARTGTGGIFD